jgi:hypothetical protein
MEGYELANGFDETDVEHTRYWTDGKNVFFGSNEIKQADPDSFMQYPGYIAYAKDKNNVYRESKLFKEADKETFEVLNFTYAKDKLNVWIMIGKIENVDAETFEACDDGKYSQGKHIKNGKWYESFVPYSFGKDKNNVYYYDTLGKIKILKNVISKTFVSLNDGYFGYDENTVFCKHNRLNKANPKTWKLYKDGYLYSKDKYIYYLNRIIKDADLETFEIVEINKNGYIPQYAKDKNNYYNNDTIITKEKFENELEKHKNMEV